MDLAALRRTLLDLLATARQPDAAQLARMTASDWNRLDAMAAQHRLQPRLHALHQENSSAPEAIRAAWRGEHRLSAMRAMVQQAELRECCAQLEAQGFAPLALKGAWLAWHAYPEAAQRPLRDLDLLLPPDRVVAAYDVLVASGHALDDELEFTIDEMVRMEKHLPALAAPRGTRIELHHRMWEPDGRLDHSSPDADEDAVRARAVRIGSIGYPAADDMLAHLIIHAAYSHRLDCGPLVLTDIHFLLQSVTIDGPALRVRAEREGWLAGASLLLALVARYHGGGMLEGFADAKPPATVVDAAPDLLLQDLATRKSAGFAAAALTAGPARLLRRLRGRRESSTGESSQRDMRDDGGFIGWAVSRLGRSLGDLAHGDVRRQSRDLARLSRWLDRREHM